MVSVSGLAAPDVGAKRFERLQLGIVLLSVLVILLFVVSSAHDAWRSYRYTLSSTDRELTNMAKALAEQTVWSLQSVDLLLLDTVRWYRSERRSIPPADVDAVLAARTAGVPPVRQVTIFDAQGDQLYRSRGFSIPNHNVADRSYFIAQRDDPRAGLFMSEPLITRSEGRTAVILSRRLDDDQGHFAGVVVANVDLEDLNQLYSAVDVGTGIAIQLLRDDGTVLVRNPPEADVIGRRFPPLAAPVAASVSRVLNPIDGHDDFIAVDRVRHTPLRLAVTRDADIALQSWREETIRVTIRTLIVVLLSAVTLIVMMRQIRAVARGQRALRESEQRYALAMEGANEGHWDWDARNDRLFLSPRMRALDGDQALGTVVTGSEWLARVAMHGEDRPRFETALRHHFAGRQPRFECEYRVQHPSGEWHWLLARGRCQFDAAGKPIRFVGSAIDITVQKQAEIEKMQLESQLRQSQKMEAIGTLAGGIAHDFNNMLGAILGYGELALQRAGHDIDLGRYLENVLHAAERAKLLVERILGFSRSGLGDRVLVNVQAVVEETLELLEASLPIGIRIQRSLTAGNAAVMGDPTYLHQVTMNLCTNALQAMEAGGVIEVSLARVDLVEPRKIGRDSVAAGGYLRLTVSDTGAGMAPNIVERIFDPFFTTKKVGEGTGLGLSVVHGIVADLGGSIDVASAPGKGSRFDIWLPQAGEASMPLEREVDDLPHGHGEILMIVDDEPPLVALAEEIVARLGYEPLGFVSSRVAWEAFLAAPHRFDALLTDESMPEMTGAELARQIRRLRPDLPILLMSGHRDAELATRAREAGIDNVLQKPLHGREIAAALAGVLCKT